MFQDGPGRPLRVALALATPIVRHGLQAVLAAENEVELVAEADDALVLTRALVALQPDVAVVDCDPLGRWNAVLGSVAHLATRTAVLVFGPLDAECVTAMFLAGVKGYLHYSEDMARVGEAVRACGRGDVWCSPSVVSFMIPIQVRQSQRQWLNQPARVADEGGLTERQWQVLSLAAEGESNRAIALSLGVRESTVEEHLTKIYARLGVSGRVGAVRWYFERQGRTGGIPRDA